MAAKEDAEETRMTDSTPDTIVLVHGFWVTPRSWEQWIERYEAAGYKVLAPAYPGFEVEVEALNDDPSPIEALTVPEIIGRFEQVIGELDSPRSSSATPRAVRSPRSFSTTDMEPRE